MTFESFVKSLIAASERYNRLIPLRDNLMSMIGEYQDCVKACEHQHSKRTFERVSDSFTRPEICKFCKQIFNFTVHSTLILKLHRLHIGNTLSTLKGQFFLNFLNSIRYFDSNYNYSFTFYFLFSQQFWQIDDYVCSKLI